MMNPIDPASSPAGNGESSSEVLWKIFLTTLITLLGGGILWYFMG
ncbi:MAG: hypothetical protein OZSIB_3219 [Candidatus Ozemobacter sibiricus]|uniref:Uncharacterized protein n=1 Tax=Candidatus Ozemobacter sibiricus TaxID=2268124 RepID=A0A367ZQT3_9BACT|nr:MAG: hypothetical protein OZSIB_3219 [Candidatus Ozemobacter sibiricus]